MAYLGNMVLIYAIAASVALFVEMPYAALEQLLMARR